FRTLSCLPSHLFFLPPYCLLFSSNAPATPDIYTLSLHDALPISSVGRGKGLVRLIDEDGTKAWTVLTALQELTGHEEPQGPRRLKGAVHGVDAERKSWSERLAEEDAAWGRTADPYILVVGGGQGGIALGRTE